MAKESGLGNTVLLVGRSGEGGVSVERSRSVGVVGADRCSATGIVDIDARVKGLRIGHFVIHSAEGLIVINAEPGANAGAPVTKDIPGQATRGSEQLPV